jgi:hypothetical protein
MARPKGESAAGEGKVKRFLARIVPGRARSTPEGGGQAPTVQVNPPQPLKNPAPSAVRMRSTLVRGLAQPLPPKPRSGPAAAPASPSPSRSRYTTKGPRSKQKRDYPIL